MKTLSIDFSQLSHATADELKVVGSERRGSNGFTVVNAARNGKRAKLTIALHEALGSPKRLQFASDKNYLYIGKIIPHCTEYVSFSSGTGTNIIYDTGFVFYLTNQFNLDFSNCTSISFREIEIGTQEYEGQEITYAKIKMKK